ncbi:MAG: VTT domain-containing protein [Anaerolineaceae bacterium]|nr:VTT domain-containing protein [Anaerolineaceae bacterium]
MSWIEKHQEKIKKFLPVVILMVVATIMALTLDMKVLEAFVKTHYLLGIGLSIVLYVVLGATIIPSEPLTVMIVALGGVKAAVFLALFGNTLAAIMEYYIGRNIADAADLDMYQKKMPKWLQKIPMTSPLFLIVGRMLPGYGPKFVSVVCGMYKVPFTLYLWTTMVSTGMGAVLIALGAFGVFKLM